MDYENNDRPVTSHLLVTCPLSSCIYSCSLIDMYNCNNDACEEQKDSNRHKYIYIVLDEKRHSN